MRGGECVVCVAGGAGLMWASAPPFECATLLGSREGPCEIQEGRLTWPARTLT